MVEDLKRDFTISKCEIMLKILNTDKNKYISQNSLAKDIKISRGNPYFIEIFKYLKKIEIISMNEKENIIKINKNKLKKLIREQDNINKWVIEFFRPYYPFP